MKQIPQPIKRGLQLVIADKKRWLALLSMLMVFTLLIVTFSWYKNQVTGNCVVAGLLFHSHITEKSFHLSRIFSHGGLRGTGYDQMITLIPSRIKTTAPSKVQRLPSNFPDHLPAIPPRAASRAVTTPIIITSNIILLRAIQR